MSLSMGDLAPDFTLLTDAGTPLTLSHLRGKSVALYFYPKDLTPGCTEQACDFRDQFEQLKNKSIIVLGVSKDSVKTHQKFKEKHGLPFALLSDPQGKVCEAYGVFRSKSMFGQTFLGIDRSTFLINPEGRIAGIWRKVKIKGHVEQVINEYNRRN